jgi:hypothetical protein
MRIGRRQYESFLDEGILEKLSGERPALDR